MKNKELSDKYCSRFVAEGLIKSALCASTLGFALSLISAIVSLSTGTKLIWLSALLFLAADAVGIPLFYYAKFRPKTMQMANRLDKSGLQERVVTMLELADEQTTLAEMQRSDTEKQLEASNPKRVKIIIPVSQIVWLLTTALVSLSLNVFAAFYSGCRHDWGDWIVTQPATCVSAGQEVRFCKKEPSHFEKRPIAVNDAHDWADWAVSVPAKADEYGEETRICKNCSDHIERRKIFPSGSEGLHFSETSTYISANKPVTGYAVSKGSALASEIYIPAVFNEKPVVSIAFSGFENSRQLESLHLPEGLIFIDVRAFSNCISLKSVTIPSSVTLLHCDSFRFCESLESVVIEDARQTVTIYQNAFAYCKNLKSVTLPENVYLYDGAFEGCTALSDIYYNGSEERWSEIAANCGEELSNVTVHFSKESSAPQKSENLFSVIALLSKRKSF
jgi:hypothetical protein